MKSTTKTGRKIRNAMLAAASAMAASAALAPAGANDFDAAAQPAVAEIQLVPVDMAATAHTEDKTPITPKKWALIAAAAGALAALVKLIGARRVAEAVTDGAVRAVRVTGKAASGVASAVGRSVASPLRFLAALFGLVLFALTGVGLFDLEWIGGLLSGAALAGAGLYGFIKTRRVLQPAKVRASRNMENEN
jgi:hypothetical protein